MNRRNVFTSASTDNMRRNYVKQEPERERDRESIVTALGIGMRWNALAAIYRRLHSLQFHHCQRRLERYKSPEILIFRTYSIRLQYLPFPLPFEMSGERRISVGRKSLFLRKNGRELCFFKLFDTLQIASFFHHLIRRLHFWIILFWDEQNMRICAWMKWGPILRGWYQRWIRLDITRSLYLFEYWHANTREKVRRCLCSLDLYIYSDLHERIH